MQGILALAAYLDHLGSFKKPLSRLQLRPIKSESLNVEPRHQYLDSSAGTYEMQPRLRMAAVSGVHRSYTLLYQLLFPATNLSDHTCYFSILLIHILCMHYFSL